MEELDDDSGDEPAARGISPYLFEPLAEVVDAPPGELGEDAEARAADLDGEALAPAAAGAMRLGNNNWCSCSGGCIPFDAVSEGVHMLQRIPVLVRKMSDYTDGEEDLNCITEHPGFQPVCLDKWVLETAYFQYVQQYEDHHRRDVTENERSRHIAYRQLVRWCWGFLGRRIRVRLPSCAVTTIRNSYPSEVYRGFKDI
ncbi:uncharacterized protein [Diadema setosum]|uniref:uncharacterized protein n=1 Tax=Diadema setosum TaxID=31175 RepID=UPI003B3B446F